MQEWLTAELRTLDLGDKRLNARQAMILDKLAARPKDSLPGATCSWAELPAAYRFCDNQRITPEKVLAPHRAATIERIRREAVVLIAQDTTELVLDRDPEKGFGKLTSQIGLLDHVQIAVTPLGQHLGVTRCLLAGLVALLPIGGFVLTVVYLERSIAESWLARQPFYFPGLGLIASTVGIYLIGLTVSTFVGRWLWALLDRVLDGLPMLGRLYQTLKQIVGYSDGKDAIFQGVVLVPNGKNEGSEMGLVTNEVANAGGARQLVVFVPNAPNPTAGRLIVIDAGQVQPLAMAVSDAMKVLLSVGKTSLVLPAAGGGTAP